MLDEEVLLPAAGHIHIPYANHYGDDGARVRLLQPWVICLPSVCVPSPALPPRWPLTNVHRPVGAHGSFRATRGATNGGESVVALASIPPSSTVVSPTNGRPHVSTNGNNTTNNSHHHPSLPSLASSNTELASSFAATPVSNHSISPTTSHQTTVIPHNIIPDHRPMSRHDSGEGTRFFPSTLFSSGDRRS
jgi:hypothetical protein